MKFLHTSDWHLGARLGEFSRLDEQREVLEEIRILADAENVDFIIIAGDIFDNFNPPNEAVELLYRELKKLTNNTKRPVIVIAGNHDSPDRIEAPDPLAAECGIFFIGYPDFIRPEVIFDDSRVSFPEKGIVMIEIAGNPPVRILTTPYANENRLRKYLEAGKREEQLAEILSESWEALASSYCDAKGINILTAHLFMTDSPRKVSKQPGLFGEEEVRVKLEEPEEERSILHPGGLELIDAALVPSEIQYTALGHLHRPQIVREGVSPVVYAGSPLSFGLSEEDQQKSVVIVELEPGGVAGIEQHSLRCGRRIIRKTFSDIDTAVLWLNDNQDCYVELLVECDSFISAGDRRRLYDAHEGITAVIPLSRHDGAVTSEDGVKHQMPDLSGSIEQLFISYFDYKKGMEPDEEMLSLFREVTAQAKISDTGGSE